MSNIEYTKSPLNYIGGKFKLLPQILPLFPNKINRFIDLFCGGCNVAINVDAKTIICNDSQFQIMELLQNLKNTDTEEAFDKIMTIIKKYGLSKKNKEGFKQLRYDYNNIDDSWCMFYALICYSFNNQIRFNNKGEYNLPVGMRSFNPTLQKKFKLFTNLLHNKNIKFTCKDFRTLDLNKLNSKDFVYLDPPYLITTASYNEKNGWNEKDEIDLLEILDSLNSKNIKFALSNVLENSGKSNDILKEWSKQYKINYLSNTYKNCNYHKKDKSEDSTIEVLITNY